VLNGSWNFNDNERELLPAKCVLFIQYTGMQFFGSAFVFAASLGHLGFSIPIGYVQPVCPQPARTVERPDL
jgi:hypothetical protein